MKAEVRHNALAADIPPPAGVDSRQWKAKERKGLLKAGDNMRKEFASLGNYITSITM